MASAQTFPLRKKKVVWEVRKVLCRTKTVAIYRCDNVVRGAHFQAQIRPVEFKVAEALSIAASLADDEEIHTFVTAMADATKSRDM